MMSAQDLEAAVLLHALSNVSWNLFPNNASGFDPMYATAILAAGLGVIAMTRWR